MSNFGQPNEGSNQFYDFSNVKVLNFPLNPSKQCLPLPTVCKAEQEAKAA